jgi:PAS domain S-box-containing protein
MDEAPLAHWSGAAAGSQPFDRRRAFRAGRVAAWSWDLSTGRVHRCESFRALFGLTSGPPGEFHERIHPDDRERHRRALDRTIRTGDPYDIELRFLAPDGTTLWVEDRAELQVGPDGRRTLSGITADITSRVTAHADACLNRERLEDFSNIASDWFWETDAEFRLTFLSGLTQLLPEAVALGRTRWEGIGADLDQEPWASHLRLLHARKDFRDFEFETRTRTGRPIWISSSGRALFDAAGAFTGYRGVSSNITDRKQAAAERERIVEQLHHAQKTETIGRLTGGLAHDFNNLLTVILGNAELLLEEMTDPRLKDLAAMIQTAAERGADLNQKLLTFGRRQSLRPGPVSLDAVVSGITPLLQRALGEHIEVRTSGSAGHAVAMVDRTQLESAILNLAVNARDAMPKGGTLTLEAEEVAAPGGDIEYVSLTVADTGTGIAPDALARVFEPFFTTKEVGKGTGLGLAMVHGFVEQSGGHVTIRSVLGQGTAVTLFLPAGRAAVPARDPGPAPPPARPDGRGRILVVDEPDIRRFAISTLQALGFEVLEASDGEAALALLGRDAGVDLLLTEVVLPKAMSGLELARRAQALRPMLKVLLTSGSPEDAFRQHGRPREDLPLLRKPCRRVALAETVRRVLNPPAGAGLPPEEAPRDPAGEGAVSPAAAAPAGLRPDGPVRRSRGESAAP